MATQPRQEIEPRRAEDDLARAFGGGQGHDRPAVFAEAAVEPQQSVSDWVTDRPAAMWVVIALIVIAGLVSELALRPAFEQPETWSATVRVLDEKKANVLALTTAAITLSAGISAIPDDTGTPIAEQLSQLATNLGIVLAMLYLEKYLLTILSVLSFGFLIPLTCVLFVAAILMHNRFTTSRVLRIAGTRILVVALIAIAVVPASVWVTERIDETYEVSIEQQAAAAASDAAEAGSGDQAGQSQAESGGSFVDNLVSIATNLGSTITSGLQSVTDGIITKVNNLIEGAVVMIVTSCVIPILVLLVFMWLGHTLLGIDLSGPADALARQLRRPIHRPALGKAARTTARELER